MTAELLTGSDDGRARWVAAGPITEWAPVIGRASRPLFGSGGSVRITLAKAENPPNHRLVNEWLSWQSRMRLPFIAPLAPVTSLTSRASSSELVFWRLSVRTRVFAIGAQPSYSVEEAIQRVTAVTSQAKRAEVFLGFFDREVLPRWQVAIDGVPQFLGLPEVHLMATVDATKSLAVALHSARLHRDVREIGVGASI